MRRHCAARSYKAMNPHQVRQEAARRPAPDLGARAVSMGMGGTAGGDGSPGPSTGWHVAWRSTACPGLTLSTWMDCWASANSCAPGQGPHGFELEGVPDDLGLLDEVLGQASDQVSGELGGPLRMAAVGNQ